LHHDNQKSAAEYAIRQQEQASNKPGYPWRIEEPGGIGVTPVRSIVLHAIRCGLLFVAGFNDIEARSCRFS
jgi:hypothetical protein